MSDSPIPFPGRDFDSTNPDHVAAWVAALPPIDREPNRLPIAHFGVPIDDEIVSFRITREALVALDGDDDLSSATMLQLYQSELERQCRALYASQEKPAAGWVLDAGDILPVF